MIVKFECCGPEAGGELVDLYLLYKDYLFHFHDLWERYLVNHLLQGLGSQIRAYTTSHGMKPTIPSFRRRKIPSKQLFFAPPECSLEICFRNSNNFSSSKLSCPTSKFHPRNARPFATPRWVFYHPAGQHDHKPLAENGEAYSHYPPQTAGSFSKGTSTAGWLYAKKEKRLVQYNLYSIYQYIYIFLLCIYITTVYNVYLNIYIHIYIHIVSAESSRKSTDCWVWGVTNLVKCLLVINGFPISQGFFEAHQFNQKRSTCPPRV